MLKLMKKNRLLTLFIVFTILFILIGIFIPSFLSNEVKEEVRGHLLELQDSMLQREDFSFISFVYESLPHNLYLILFWLLGISILGIFLLFGLYITRVFLFFSEFTFFILNIKEIHGIWLFFYFISQGFRLILYFFLTYYAIRYSAFLFQLLFLKKDYPIKIITKQYLKVLLIGILFSSLCSFFEFFLFPKLWNIFL